METRSNHILVGGVVLGLLAALAGFIVWLAGINGGLTKSYDIFFQQSVEGLSQGGTVTYAGGQHVTWLFAESACVNRVADAYILSERLPAMDRACRNTVRPVPASASPAG